MNNTNIFQITNGIHLISEWSLILRGGLGSAMATPARDYLPNTTKPVSPRNRTTQPSLHPFGVQLCVQCNTTMGITEFTPHGLHIHFPVERRRFVG
jgi:hypothetical protein